MIFKLKKIYDSITLQTDSQIVDNQQFDYFISKLLERKLVIEHDIHLLKNYIVDFPFNFNQLCCYIRQIFRLEIESQIESNICTFDDLMNKINKFISFYPKEDLTVTNDDFAEIISTLSKTYDNFSNGIINLSKTDFVLKNIRDDIKKFLWEKIYQTMENKSEDFFEKLDVVFVDPEDYQNKMQEKIQYEYEIIRTKRIHYSSHKEKPIKKIKSILVEKAYCVDRDIAIQCWKVPNNFYDKEILSAFYAKCEASKELLLSKYFQKFTGYDDISSEDFQYYFFESLDTGVQLIPFLSSLDSEISETSFLFKYIAKEILCSLRDLLSKCTYSFHFPITVRNFFYEPKQFRLYIQDIQYGQKRKSIYDSHQILEAKLLYFYGLILLNILAITYPDLNTLVNEMNLACEKLQEFDKMQKIFDYVLRIEEILARNLDNDVIICIIIECLVSPYKAKIVFDEFYETKNFLSIAKNENGKCSNIQGREIENPQKKECDIVNLEIEEDKDKCIALNPYYDNHMEDKNDTITKKSMTINLLLIHPFYSNTDLDANFLLYLLKTPKDKKR